MAGLCQDCTGCCEVLEVPQVNKAFLEPCKYLGQTFFGKGCIAYLERPDVCKRYVCLWLESQRRSDVASLPENMRPDVSKCVLGWPYSQDRETMFVYPFAEDQMAWLKPPVRDYLRDILAKGAKVVVVLKDKRLVFKGDVGLIGTEEEFAELNM